MLMIAPQCSKVDPAGLEPLAGVRKSRKATVKKTKKHGPWVWHLYLEYFNISIIQLYHQITITLRNETETRCKTQNFTQNTKISFWIIHFYFLSICPIVQCSNNYQNIDNFKSIKETFKKFVKYNCTFFMTINVEWN